MDTLALQCFSYTEQTFLVCVTVHKARNLILFNCDTYVKITLDKKSKTTKVFQNSENPIYNEYFTFELLCTLRELLRFTVLFQVKRKSKIRKDAILGELFMDLATVWSQENHSFYKKWGKLENPMSEKPSKALRGYLQIDLSIISTNEPPAPAYLDNQDYGDIEKNLLQPTNDQESILNVQYMVNIYKGDFVKKLDYLIQVSFAGMSGKTKIQKNSTSYEWNEQITFMWLYPSLSQTFFLQVMVNEMMQWKCVADYEIYFDEITYHNKLPSVGPTYIYLYDSVDTRSYIGRVLIAIKSESVEGKENIPQRFAESNRVSPISEKVLGGVENFLIECLIWQGDFIHSNSNNIKFSLNCGEYFSQEISHRLHKHNLTRWTFFLQEGSYRAIYLTAIFQDYRAKYEPDHFLAEFVHLVKTYMDYFKLFELKYSGNKHLHAKCLKALVTLFREKLKQGKYRLVYNGFKQLTEWDKNRLHFFEQFYNDFQLELDNYRKNLKSKNPEYLANVSKVFANLLRKTENIEAMITMRAQDNLPDLILNVNMGNKVVAYSKLDCKQFMYAQRQECNGLLCGKRHSIVLKPTTCHHTCRNCGCIFGKIDAWIWIGSESERNGHMELQGWIQEEPFLYHIADIKIYNLKLYIHQAKIRPGADKTGLCDAKIRVTFLNLAADTSVVYASLSPIWNEVILFHNIILPGRSESFLENPPLVALEVFDEDKKDSLDFLGNGFIRPSVKLLDDNVLPIQEIYDRAINDKIKQTDSEVKNQIGDSSGLFKKILKSKDAVQELNELHRLSPPPLKWIFATTEGATYLEVLMSGELIESQFEGNHGETVSVIQGIPQEICPSNKQYRISAIFAGIRNFQKSPKNTVGKFKIKIMFGNLILLSGASTSKLDKSINFQDNYVGGIVSLPEQLEYWPAIIITHVDISHKEEITVGAALISRPEKYIEIESNNCYKSSTDANISLDDSDIGEVDDYSEEKTPLLRKNEEVVKKKCRCLSFILKYLPTFVHKRFNDDRDTLNINQGNEAKTFNWWTKFYNSVRKQSEINIDDILKHKLVIYPNELEKQPEFNYFHDWAEPIRLVHGVIRKKNSPPKEESYCTLKYQIKINYNSESTGRLSGSEKSSKNEFNSKYEGLSAFSPEVKVVVRIYVVQGIKLRSKDHLSQSDAFIRLQFGAQKISDRANYVPNQLNPIFGKRFQMEGLIPREHILHISVYDHGVPDELIGCTCIDLEDRLRSKHCAFFGIPDEYCSSGYNVWRGPKSPHTVLNEICNNYCTESPKFMETNEVIVGGIKFEDSTKIAKNENIKERLSLSVLKRLDEIPEIGFKLVPEHVETRSLYRSDRPGMEQGKLQLWVEIFEADQVPAPIDITPVAPQMYELRVIIYNTKDVILDEANVFGKSMSDIYLKAWVEDIDAAQHTDVHYRSLNGEGNFNWRMIFPIRYSENEEMMVIMKKQSIFDESKTEEKCPPILFVQIWDNDAISADDFLGAINLDLTHCPVPSTTSRNCTLKEKSLKYLNLFKVKIIRGWFPAKGKTKDGSVGLTGKVELEMRILTETEALANPVGKARNPPNALSAPNCKTLQRINNTMPNLFNGFHIGNREVSPNFTRSTTLATEQTESRRKKYRKLWMLHKLKPLTSPDSIDVESPQGTDGNELETILPHEDVNRQEVCLLRDSPYRILRAAESGNLEDFIRLYQGDNSRLSIQDGKGRTAAHQAAARNRVNILQFIREKEGNFNAQDNAGNTPIHVAVENDSLDALDYLLTANVNTSILNEKKQAPVHLATEMNKVKALQVMGKHRGLIDIQQGGEHGRTALHLAAIYDHEECARILITEFGACPRKPCNNGYYPIHEAAKNASSKTMEVFFQWGESRGCTREEMISFYDSEGNVPLHSAVHGGDIKAVELCLKSGAKISTQQHDLSTPVHLACAQGAIDIVKLMFCMQPLEKKICLVCTDVQKMTPLHCASMFDHPEIVEFLIAEGADINALDKEHRSPLLLAASRSGWKTVNTLIRMGANISIKDTNYRNVLHFVIMNGGRLAEFSEEVSKTQSKTQLVQLLNEKDNTGCSPLHYASREGHIRSLENLIRLGAVINLKNNNNESPLHFAARYGRYNTVRQLLDSEKGSFIINESDGEGLTPLHIASQQGHTRVVQLLLNRGALLHRDHNGRNPLHLAAMSGYTQTMELLHSVHSHLLDQVDKDGNTALHLATMENKPNSISILLSMGCKLLYNSMDMSAIDYAIYYKYPEAALAMVTHEERADEVMALKSDKHPCVTLALIASMPRVFEAVQDKCITKANCKKDSKSFYIKYSFRPYQRSQEEIDKQRKALNDPKWRPPPLCVANTMVSHGRVELLAHPLSQKYLQMKWNSYGKYFHLTNLLFYSVFLIFVTLFSSQMMSNIDIRNSTEIMDMSVKEDDKIENFTTPIPEPLSTPYFAVKDENDEYIIKTTGIMVSGIAVIVYISLNSLREVVQMYQQKLHYILEVTNIISWVLHISALIMMWPVFFGDGRVANIHYSAASITVFLSWFRLLLFLQRFDQVGIYVVMFLEILQTLIKVLLVFSILIIAFGLAFFILLSKISSAQANHLSFSNIPMSLLRTFSMMLGELDFVGTYVNPFYQNQLKMAIPSFLILSLFMILMPILLMNLLIGLAVGDIESVRRNAQLKRLAMQVVLHTELERKLPQMWLERIDKKELIEYPNDTKCKLGFLDSVLRKWFYNPFSEDSGMDMPFENNDDYVTAEIEKQKRKLREISRVLDQQHQLLRLIVQKMEIKTEADDVDEGVSPTDLRPMSAYPLGSSKWTSPRIRKKLRTALSFTRTSN